jgi:hypothetical protein
MNENIDFERKRNKEGRKDDNTYKKQKRKKNNKKKTYDKKIKKE